MESETNPENPENPEQGHAEAPAGEVKPKRKNVQKTLRRDRETFQAAHQQLLDDKESLANVSGGSRDGGIMDIVVKATVRAFDNMAALKLARVPEERAPYNGPVIIEGVNPISNLFLHAVKLFAREVTFSHRCYPRASKHYFRFPLATILHRPAEVYVRRMRVEFNCFVAPIRNAPPEGITYLNLRDMKRLWELPHHQLFVATMLQICRDAGQDRIDRHDLNLLMHGQREAARLFRLVDPEARDYEVDESALYAVSCAVQKWGGVLLKASRGEVAQVVRIPNGLGIHKGDTLKPSGLRHELDVAAVSVF